jgi:hypothetical protein
MHISYFSIFYSTTFTVLALILVVLLLITPGDGIYQAYRSGRLGQILSIAGVYLLCLIVALLIYSTRLYTNKTHLQGIPRAWIPFREGDVRKFVRRLIIESLQRSATIAYEAHPRDLSKDLSQEPIPEATARPETSQSSQNPLPTPIWGTISHPGWSPPSSHDFPSLHFLPVILELPHLIEAKAVSLAPPDPYYAPDPPSTPTPASPTPQTVPDALAVSLLQRPAQTGLRDYISHLTILSLINPPELGPEFVEQYERARFSDIPLTEPEFRTLMSIFANILHGMTHLPASIIADLHANSSSDSYPTDESDTESSVDARSISTTNTVEHTPFHTPMPYSDGFDSPGLRREVSEGSLAGSEGTIRTAPSRARRTRTPSRAAGTREASRGTGTGGSGRKSGSGRSRRQTIEALRMTSMGKLSRKSSTAGSARSGGSVIRLAERSGPLDLPYVIQGLDDGEE